MFSARVWPAGGVFSVKGSAGFFSGDEALALGLMNSRVFNGFLSFLVGAGDAAARSYQVGTLGRVPFPASGAANTKSRIAELALQGLRIKRSLDTAEPTSPMFLVPQLLGDNSTTLSKRANACANRYATGEAEVRRIQLEIDDLASDLYGLDETERAALTATLAVEASEGSSDGTDSDDSADDSLSNDATALVAQVIDYSLGIVFGRWDIRYATGERPALELPDPFAPLPVCPPGMLQGDDGLPLSPEAGRRLRTEGRYPLDVAWDGILVDDPEHPLDLERRALAALAVLWGGGATSTSADALEHEACALLGVRDLRDWLRRPTAFFADHLKRHSKSRRQAPIYWPLSTASGSYTLWLYYHRLTDQTLYKCIHQFIDPKLADVEKAVVHLRSVLDAGEASTKTRRQLDDAEQLRTELKEMRAELEHWASRWKPNLNDGVLITASPLWKLFRLPKWRKDLEACWKELEAGDYDWAHLAHTLWSDRVRQKCKTDRSLAIAHGLEELCEVQAPKPKAKRATKADAAAKEREARKEELREQLTEALANILLGEKLPIDVTNAQTGEPIIPANRKITKTLLRKLAGVYEHADIAPSPIRDKIREVIAPFEHKFAELELAEQRVLAMDAD